MRIDIPARGPLGAPPPQRLAEGDSVAHRLRSALASPNRGGKQRLPNLLSLASASVVLLAYATNRIRCTCGGTPTRRHTRLMPTPLDTMARTPPSTHSPLIHACLRGSKKNV